jgi:hypothetical protein
MLSEKAQPPQSDAGEYSQSSTKAAHAYRGVFHDDRCTRPYMPENELGRTRSRQRQLLGLQEEGELLGVIGIQDRGAVRTRASTHMLLQPRREGRRNEALTHV